MIHVLIAYAYSCAICSTALWFVALKMNDSWFTRSSFTFAYSRLLFSLDFLCPCKAMLYIAYCGDIAFTLSVPLPSCPSWCLSCGRLNLRASRAGHRQEASRHDGRRPAYCPFGRVHSRQSRATMIDRPQVGESIPMQKWNSPQGRQVHYTDAAAGHQMTAGGLQLTWFLPPHNYNLHTYTGSVIHGI